MATKRNTERSTVKKQPRSSDAIDYEALAAQFRVSKAPITEGQMHRIADQFLERGKTVRCALAVLTRSGEELIKSLADDHKTASAFAALAENIKNLNAWIDSLKEMLECADTRITIALCYREDGTKIIKAAEEKMKAAA